MFSRSLVSLTGFVSLLTAPALAQITPAPNTTGTTVETVNNQFNIGGGQLSGDGRNLFHLFRDFNVQQGQTANFLSTPQIQNILAGVNGGSASYINGILKVTGGNSNLYLLNPAGIVFGSNAQLNLPAAFHASTAQRVHFGGGIFDLNGSNSYTQLNGSPLGFEFANRGILINEGNLSVNAGQSLTLMAHQIINTGTLGAAGGTVNVVAVPESSLVRVSQEGMLLSLEIPQERLPAAGIIQPIDLPTLLTGGNGYPAVNSVTRNPDGTIRLVHDSTKIPLTTNTAVIGGTIDVSHATGSGGKITIAGQGSNIALMNAQLTAAGNTGGGTVLVGGDYLGGTTGTNRLDRSFNAENLFINGGTSLNADALSQGDGGTVINWADNSTRFYGQISARGGALSGNGGFVEVSGKQYLDFQGTVDTTAPNGTTGTLLLDPTDIYIIDGRSDFNITSTSPFEAASNFYPFSKLSIGTLLSALSSTNVIVTTASTASSTGNIYVQTPISSSSTNSLTLQADNNIIIGYPISLQGSLILQAQGLIQNQEFQNNPINISAANIIANAPIQTSGTNITLQASGNISLPSVGNVLSTSGGSINLQSSGGLISLGGSVNASSSTIQITGSTNLLNSTNFLGGNITFDGNITGNHPLTITSNGQATVTGIINAANLIINASGNIQLNNVTTSSGINLDSGLFNITTGNLQVTQSSGIIRVVAPKNITLGSLSSAGGAIAVFSGGQSISTGNINSNGGFVYLDSITGITTGNVTTGGGNFDAVAYGGQLTTGSINTAGSGGSVTLFAPNITTGNIFTNGGSFLAQTGSFPVQTYKITIDSILNGSSTLRGLLTNQASPTGNLTFGYLATNGGDINLRAGDIVFNSINAETGKIDIYAENLLRALGTFDRNGVPTSIFGRSVNIFINNDRSFSVGNSALNGIAGAIQSENSVIAPPRTLSGLVEVGNIRFENKGQNPQNLSEQQASILLEPPPLVIEGASQVPSESPPILLTGEIEIALANNNLSRALALLDQRGCEEVTSYFGRPCDRSELSIEELQAALNEIAKQTGKKPAVIYTLARPDQLDLMMVTPEGEPIHVPVRGVGREQLLKTVDQFTNSVRDPRLVNTRAYLPASQQLYQWLIAPLRSQLDAQGVETLVFVLDSGMRGIPVAALHDGQGFLIERFSMALVPSMSLMDTRYRSVQQARILAMGASEFKDQSPLPAVPLELAQITKDLGGGTEFLNADFTIPNLQRQHRQGTYQIIHLATHGEFQPGSPESSYIAFTDGRLNLLQLRNLRLYRPETELLTLSACRTAVGDLDAELGFAGLSVQSGVKSVLASLWYVSDEGTLALMTGFYNQLNTAPIKAEALRQAQLAMLRGDITVKGNELRTIRGGIPLPPQVAVGDRSLSHPYFWAAFTMIGSPW
ncbi:CHAT domain-containing protein [Thermosynechococcus sichuanensis E542]|uniref:CHAT domain-containing protein n=1 Tax=Thermosynechococcus sichuanensis E542 TaxID=2016101 RepID=A0A3B7MC72_9CYAN|nr:CHAT domain-containing protein [Thermosynechococcus vestitus]AXY67472.2 CHAT domain-containing protein [Thermosynechococcus vestitus E542]